MKRMRMKRRMDMTEILPRECICQIISFTTPKDACRSSALSRAFKECADSDETWEAFLPSDIRKDLITRFSLSNLISPKKLFLHLLDLDKPMFFSLAKYGGKKCCMIVAKGLLYNFAMLGGFWKWVSIRQSRFSHVAELDHVTHFEVKGYFNIKLLSPKTQYDVFFIFMFNDKIEGFKETPVNFSITEGGQGRSVVLDPPGIDVMQREDGWMEVKAGEFFTEEGKGSVTFIARETTREKRGILIEGIEFRPAKNE